MATMAGSKQASAERKPPLFTSRPDWLDWTLALGCLAMLATMVTAIARGAEQWALIGPALWYHFVTVGIALAITPVMLIRRRGDRLHRTLGYVWIVAMVTTALSTVFIREINDGGFSWIHLLSVFTLFVSWKIVASARAHDHHAHRGHVRGIVIGALLVAGFFTFQFNRLFANWLAL